MANDPTPLWLRAKYVSNYDNTVDGLRERAQRAESRLEAEFTRSEILTEALETIAYGPGLGSLEDAMEVAADAIMTAQDVPRSPRN